MTAATATAVRPALFSVGELFGGVERQLLGLCRYLQRRGVDPHLILFHDRELAAQARAIGVEPLFAPSRHSYDLGAGRRLAALLDSLEVNVVHAHGYRAVTNLALAGRHRRFGAVRTVHGLVEPMAGNPLAWLKSRAYRWLESRSTFALGAAVVYVTDDMRRRHAGLHEGLRQLTIHNGMDPLDPGDTTRPAEYERDAFHLAIVGRVTAVKGIGHALRALAHPDLPARVVLDILGGGPQERTLADEARALGLEGRVRFLGFRRNIHDYLAHCDALLMPSLHEGLPYTLLEAMSLGVPILASRVGGLMEVLRDGETGLLFPPRDPAAIRAAVRRLLDEPALGRRLGAAARREQRERYTLEVMGDAYWELYTAAAGVGVGRDG